MVASSPFLCPSRLRRSLGRSRETRFTLPNRRACSQARGLLCDCPITLPNYKLTSHWTISVTLCLWPQCRPQSSSAHDGQGGKLAPYSQSQKHMLWDRECCGRWASVCNISWEKVSKSSENHQNIFVHFRQHLEVFRKPLGMFGNSNHDKMKTSSHIWLRNSWQV